MSWIETLRQVECTDWTGRGDMELQGIVDVPEGKAGEWMISKFALDREQSLGSMFQMKERMVPSGNYTRLVEGRTLYMSDTPAEMSDHVPLIKALMLSGGVQRVLVFGLGIGMVMEMLMELHSIGRLDIDHVLFVEKSQDVIDLVAPHYLRKYPGQFRVVCADAFDYTPTDACYEAVWIDIWEQPEPEYACDAQLLIDIWQDSADWVGCWMEEEMLGKRSELDFLLS